jgi:predicted PurR-regulated permease PerM
VISTLPASRWTALALGLAALAVVAPLLPALVLAAWFADVVHPVADRLERAFAVLRGGRRWAAASLTFALLVVTLTPVVGALLVGYHEVVELVVRLRAAETLDDTLTRTLRANGAEIEPRVLAAVAGRVLKGSVHLVVSALVFLFTSFSFIVAGRRVYALAEEAMPLPARHFRRLVAAFRETGRGLLVGVGATAVVQGTIAGVAYAVLGVPSPILLGVLTAACALVPPFGTALVWLPAAIGLVASGEVGHGLALAAIGAGVVSTIDNVLRPWLSRLGSLQLPTFVLFVAMLGGLAVLGPAGLVLGPLALRLAREAFAILREEEGAPVPGE